MALPPGPENRFVTVWRWLREPFDFLDEQRSRFGDAFTMRLPGLPPLVVFANPEAVKQIFTDDGETMLAGKFNLSLRAFLGEHSVLMLDGKEHLRVRRVLLPPFHGERMQAYGRAMIDLTEASMRDWPRKKAFALHDRFQAITLRVIVRTVFGVEEGPRFERLCEQLTRLTEIAAWPPLLLPIMQKDLGPLSPWGRFQRKAAEVDEALLAEIRMRRASGTTGRTDVLSLLVDAKDENGVGLSDEELRDELVTLLVAGHETTATSLAWAFRWVLDVPEVRTRLEAELTEATREGRGAPLTPERIAKLEYLDAVVRETLRLQPVVPVVGRVLEKPITIGEYDLPAGVAVVCSIYSAQRRASSYPSPRRFDPERFFRVKPSPYEFFPFGGGIRRCIGMAFALYEMKMVIAAVLARTNLRLAKGKPIRVVRRSITLTPSEGMRVIW
jgi:cytochrome P450